MKSSALWALIVLNVVLFASFIWQRMPANSAMAQRAPAVAARPGDYIMVPVDVTGATAGVVVVVDQTNARLSAFSYDDANHTLDAMRSVDLRRVFNGTPAAAPARGRGY